MGRTGEMLIEINEGYNKKHELKPKINYEHEDKEFAYYMLTVMALLFIIFTVSFAYSLFFG